VDYTSKLAIGTAQWGLDYGATNTSGRLGDSVVSTLMDSMRANTIAHLDTAASYGDSESRIGSLDTTGIHIQTKLSAKGRTCKQLRAQLRESLTRLNAESVNSLLIHDWYVLDQKEIEAVSQFFELSVNEGLTHHVGVSAYDLSDLDRAKRHLAIWDTAQIPMNALDQRFLSASELFPAIAFQARSLFLQGLLLASNPDHVDVIRFHEFSQSLGVDPLTLSLQFIKQQSWLHSMIIAPTSLNEFDQILNAMDSHTPDIDFDACVSLDVKLLDPRTWN
jgi:aryl-alcohol dehydrogenase-like predicted oxidoreductase